MTKITFVIIMLAFCSNAVSQNILKGTIYDKKSKSPIAYAVIGVHEKYIGVISDDKGYFELKENDKIVGSDSITITCLGYRKVKMAVKDVKGDEVELFMEIAPIVLNEAVVRAADKKNIKIGISLTGTRMLSTTLFIQKELDGNDLIGREVGTTLKIKYDCDVKSLNFYVGVNAYDNIKFRVLFYSIEDGLPKDIIVNQDIIFEMKNRQDGWINVDLSKYNIHFEAGKDVAVTLMTLDETNRKLFAINATMISGNGLLRRDKTIGEWSRIAGGISLYLDAVRYKYK